MTDDYTPDTEEVRELYWAVSGLPRRDPKAWDEFDSWLRKVKADLLKEIIQEVRDIPCWYPDGDPMGGEFDLDGESHRRFVLDTLLAYGSKLF